MLNLIEEKLNELFKRKFEIESQLNAVNAEISQIVNRSIEKSKNLKYKPVWSTQSRLKLSKAMKAFHAKRKGLIS